MSDTVEKEARKTLDFLYDKKNIYNCEECPMKLVNGNTNISPEYVGPCLQQHCWVKIHVARCDFE